MRPSSTCYRPRFWRADQGIRYTGRIFETFVSPQKLEYVQRDDLCIALRPSPEVDETAQPIQRRLQTILNLEIAENGLSGRLRYNLGLQALLDADHSAAIEHFEHIIDEETDTHQVASAYVMLCETLRKAGRPKDAVHRGLDGAKRFGDYGELWFFIGRAALEAESRTRAEAAFRECQAYFSRVQPESLS